MKPIQQKYSDIIEKLEPIYAQPMQEQRSLQTFMGRLRWERSKEGQKQVNYAKDTIKRENAYHDTHPSDEYLDETKVLNGLPGLARDQRRLQEKFPDPALPGTNPWSWQINLRLQPREYSAIEARRVILTHGLAKTRERIIREHNDQVQIRVLEVALMDNQMDAANTIAAYLEIDQKTLDSIHESSMELLRTYNNNNNNRGRG